MDNVQTLAGLCAEISWCNVAGFRQQTRSSRCFVSWRYQRGWSFFQIMLIHRR